MAKEFDPYHRWLGIPPKEQPANHYRLLGLSLFESDPEVIRDAAAQRMAHVRSYQLGPHSALSQTILNELGEAKACLLDPEARAAYDQSLREQLAATEKRPRLEELFVEILDSGPPLVFPPVRRRRRLSPHKLVAVGAAIGSLVALSLVVWRFPSSRVWEVANWQEVKSAAGDSTTARQKTDEPARAKQPRGVASTGPSSAAAEKSAAKSPIAPPALAVAPFSAAQAKEHQARWGEYLKVPTETTNSVGMRFVLIPPGEFWMGSGFKPEEEVAAFKKYCSVVESKWFESEYPRHRVRITKAFYLAAHEVTVGQFQQFVAETGYQTRSEKSDTKGAYGTNVEGKFGFCPDYSWHNPGFEQGDDHPVVCVTWDDAVMFCKWLSQKEGNAYRLPTEAEWEYACRAGTTTRYWSGDDPETLVEIGNVPDETLRAKFSDTSFGIQNSDGWSFTSPVGTYKPNPFELYDTSGNVLEWCADWWGKTYYAESPTDDPVGPDSGTERVCRGGDWLDQLSVARSACRFKWGPSTPTTHTGFRVARNIP